LKNKVLVIGLDGGTFDLVTPWAEIGELPNLQKLMKEGVFATLKTTIQPSSEQAWASFMTGTNNGKHNIFGFTKQRKGSYEWTVVNSKSRRGKSLWKILSENGKRVIIINVPLTFPPEKVNGFLVSGLFTPDKKSQYTYPPEFKEEINEVCPDYIIDAGGTQTSNLRKLQDYYKKLIKQVEKRAYLTKYLMAKYKWDFFIVVFSATDRVQHKFWENMRKENDPFNKYIFNTYKKIDKAIGEFLENVDEFTDIFVISDHGFGPLCKGVVINNLLEKQDFLKTKEEKKAGSGTFNKLNNSFNKLLKLALLRLYIIIPIDKQDIIRKRFHWIGRKFSSSVVFSEIDWNKTKAYGESGNIRINLIGREPNGSVSPGKDYDDVRDEIIKALRQLKDPVKGEEIFVDVYKREEIYFGPYLNEAPDIIPHYKDGYRGLSFGSEKIFVKGGDRVFRGNTGYHTMDGIFIAHGNNIKSIGEKLGDLRIIDLTPTILYLFGLNPPHLDGRVAKEIFQKKECKTSTRMDD
jgi:predicted AlkP superfamily phosphohydrolase/phosphomutase